MITIFHGDDTEASRNAFVEQKTKEKDYLSFQEDVDLSVLHQEAKGGGLFGKKTSVFIENLVSGEKDKKKLKTIAEELNGLGTDFNVFIWEKKELTKAEANLFPKAKANVFKLPKAIFSFLDNIYPGNNGQLLNLFHETLKTTNESLILFMLVKRFRIMLALQGGGGQIDDVKFMAPWQQQRLALQGRRFSSERLIEDYNNLYEIDSSSKVGKLPMTVTQAIDFWLVSI